MTRILLSLMLFAFVGDTFGAPARRVRALDSLAATLEPDHKLAYKTVDGRELKLHFFNPPNLAPSEQRAAFVVIHGGGWSGGEPRWFYPIADHFAKRGLVGVSIEYRLLSKSSKTTVFDCVKDGRSAIRFLRSHAGELGIDPNRIIVAGGSAGGHVAVGTALFDRIDDPNDDVLVSAVPDALILLYPVIDTSDKGYGQKKIGDAWRELSPMDHVRAGLPPTLTFHGDADRVTPYPGAARFHELMLAAGNDSILVTHPGGDHGYLIFDLDLYRNFLAQTTSFLKARAIIR